MGLAAGPPILVLPSIANFQKGKLPNPKYLVIWGIINVRKTKNKTKVDIYENINFLFNNLGDRECFVKIFGNMSGIQA